MTEVTVAETRVDASPELVVNLALGYLVSRCLHVATELGSADILNGHTMAPTELAARLGANPDAIRRLLRTLAAHEIFIEDDQGRFGMTPAATLLQRGAMRDGILLCDEVSGDGAWWNAVGALRHSVMSGEPAFDRQHGMGFFD